MIKKHRLLILFLSLIAVLGGTVVAANYLLLTDSSTVELCNQKQLSGSTTSAVNVSAACLHKFNGF